MNVVVVKNYEEMSLRGAELFAKVIAAKSDCVLGLATGDTPIGMYNELVARYEKGELDFSRVRSVNLDEYYPITPDNDQSYRYFMNHHLFDRVNIDKANTMVPDGTAKDADASCKEYEAKIDALGGIDIQILGIGRNGHIGFNEPDGELIPYTHLTALTPSTIEANSRFFATEADVPKHALTMGVESVFKARQIVLLASGKNKADAVAAMLKGNLSTMCPASLLKLHPNVTLICDEDAYSLV
jgi:glucosamine-6-phosphate deaminase